MSLHNLAHHVRAKGRGKDTMLVHMTPREVQGLQALAKAKGGTLTINPETGLPEAGFLDQILPVVAMAAATYFTAGAAAPALASALSGTAFAGASGAIAGGLAGAGVGAIGAGLQGGDVGKGALYGGLGGAITGGMGGYDNVYGAAATASPEAAANQALMKAPTDVSDVYSGLAGNPTVPPGTVPTPTPNLPPGVTQAGQAAAQLPEGAARNAALESLANANKVLPEGASQLQGPGLTEAPSKLAGAQEIVRPDSYYQTAGLLGKTAMLAAPGIGGAMGEKPDQVPGLEPYSSQSTLAPDFQGYVPPRPNPYYRAQYTRYAAGGGLMDAYQAGGPVERMSMMNTAMNPQGGLYPQGMIDKTQYATPTQRPVSAEMVSEAPAYERSSPMLMARGGIADLGGYSDGGRMLKGPGDGMSDSIPGLIGNRQPARLADGEFVVPADVVSHLGNGSTDAGARKLYSMMDKIRKARTGKKKQAPAVNTRRFMPA
jgi:hypothetical protein